MRTREKGDWIECTVFSWCWYRFGSGIGNGRGAGEWGNDLPWVRSSVGTFEAVVCCLHDMGVSSSLVMVESTRAAGVHVCARSAKASCADPFYFCFAPPLISSLRARK